MSFEKEQRRLRKLWEDFMSEEECEEGAEFEPDATSDDYHPSSDNDSDSEIEARSPKIRKIVSDESLPRNLQQRGTQIAGPSSAPDVDLNSIDIVIEEVVQNTNNVDRTIEDVIENAQIDANDSGDEDNEIFQWLPVTDIYLKTFDFTEPTPGFHADLYEHYNKPPYEFYKMFVTDDIIQFMVEETNRYAQQCISINVLPKARTKDWTPTNPGEMEQFLGIILWMGLCTFPSITSYWKKKLIYKNYVPEVMSRNRFQLLLKMMHFSNNEEPTDDRLQKVTPLVVRLRESFQRLIIPPEAVCIDETLVPFRGRLKFRQYIANKKHKFGIKLFKLCLKGGYTYDFKVYCGKSQNKETAVSEQVVMELMENLLDKGRTLCTDNYYTLVTLANNLLRRNTHLIGTLRSNRKYNPKEVISKKLKVGETTAQVCKEGILVKKWKDKRDVTVLSTKHGAEMVTVRRRNQNVEKPKNIVEYNNLKSFIDISDQLKSYNTCLRRSLKWYRKLAVELLTGTALVNSYITYKEISNNKISVTEFKELLIEGLLKVEGENREQTPTPQVQHKLQDQGRANRRRCVVCYRKIFDVSGRETATRKTPQTTTRCLQCDKNICLDCFFETHVAYKV